MYNSIPVAVSKNINQYMGLLSLKKSSTGERKAYAEEQFKQQENVLYNLLEDSELDANAKAQLEMVLNIPVAEA